MCANMNLINYLSVCAMIVENNYKKLSKSVNARKVIFTYRFGRMAGNFCCRNIRDTLVDHSICHNHYNRHMYVLEKFKIIKYFIFQS